jgi:hypothetical protein
MLQALSRIHVLSITHQYIHDIIMAMKLLEVCVQPVSWINCTHAAISAAVIHDGDAVGDDNGTRDVDIEAAYLMSRGRIGHIAQQTNHPYQDNKTATIMSMNE